MSSKDKRGKEITSRNMRKSSTKLPNKLVIIRIIKRTKKKSRKVSKHLLNFRKLVNIDKILSKNGCTTRGIGKLKLL